MCWCLTPFDRLLPYRLLHGGTYDTLRSGNQCQFRQVTNGDRADTLSLRRHALYVWLVSGGRSHRVSGKRQADTLPATPPDRNDKAFLMTPTVADDARPDGSGALVSGTRGLGSRG